MYCRYCWVPKVLYYFSELCIVSLTTTRTTTTAASCQQPYPESGVRNFQILRMYAQFKALSSNFEWFNLYTIGFLFLYAHKCTVPIHMRVFVCVCLSECLCFLESRIWIFDSLWQLRRNCSRKTFSTTSPWLSWLSSTSAPYPPHLL